MLYVRMYSTYLTPKQKACQLYVVCIHTQLHIHNYVTSCAKNSKAKESTKGVLYCTCMYILAKCEIQIFFFFGSCGAEWDPNDQ